MAKEELYDKRKISADLKHAIEHIVAGQIELALNLLKAALQRENLTKRKGE